MNQQSPVTKLSENDFIQNIFQNFDQDQSGTLTHQELVKSIQKVFPQKSSPEIELILKNYELNPKMALTAVQFIQLVTKKKIQANLTRKAQFANAFKLFDKDLDGLLSPKELKQGLEKHGQTMRLQDLQILVEMADKDKDGRINFTQFVRIMSLQ